MYNLSDITRGIGKYISKSVDDKYISYLEIDDLKSIITKDLPMLHVQKILLNNIKVNCREISHLINPEDIFDYGTVNKIFYVIIYKFKLEELYELKNIDD